MIVLTLMVGLVCQSAADLPDGECKAPETQYSIATSEQQAAKDLLACQVVIAKLQLGLDQRGYTFDSMLYCDQRKVGMQR